MSKKIEVNIKGAKQETIMLGANGYNLDVNMDKHTIQIGHSSFQVTKSGKLSGDFWNIDHLGEHKLDQTNTEESIGEEIGGRLVQAGNIITLSEHLVGGGYDVHTNIFNGTLEASRIGSDETIKITARRDGNIESDLNGFSGNECSLTIDAALSALGNFDILSEENKNENVKAIRNIIS